MGLHDRKARHSTESCKATIGPLVHPESSPKGITQLAPVNCDATSPSAEARQRSTCQLMAVTVRLVVGSAPVERLQSNAVGLLAEHLARP